MKRILLILLFLPLLLKGQPVQQFLKINLAPSGLEDWNFRVGDDVRFELDITRNGILVKDVKIRYQLSYDMMPSFEERELILKDGKASIKAGTMKKPGFMRCIVYVDHDGFQYKRRATAGFDVNMIQPTTTLPEDFNEFWDKAKKDNAKVPMEVTTTLLPERCTSKTNVYHVKIQHFRKGTHIFGILCLPKAKAKFPAILKVPGAGVKGFKGDTNRADEGFITLEIGIHGIPVNLESSVYQDLRSTAIRDYYMDNWDDRDRVCYKRVYLGCVRAIDYIFSLDEFDGKNMIVQGGSQGGALAIVSAGLDERVSGVIAYYPALCDFTGYLNGRAGGWPHLFRETKDNQAVISVKANVTRYYDVVNFARHVKVPGFYSSGYNDMACPPTSVFSAYNIINADKTIYIVPETEHWLYPEQLAKTDVWLKQLLNLK